MVVGIKEGSSLVGEEGSGLAKGGRGLLCRIGEQQAPMATRF